MDTKITAYRIVDHGVDHAQYFQGHGIAFTEYDHCATGVGSSAREAADDAAEQLACGGYEITPEIEADIASISDEITAPDDCDCELWHYVSIDVR